MEPEVDVDVEENEEELTDPWALPKFTNTVVLNDGTTYTGRAALNNIEDDLWVTIEDGNFPEVFSVFLDPEKTKVITSNTSIRRTDTYDGYTKMSLIREDGNQISIRMKKS